MAAAKPFADSVEHVLAELERIDLRVRARVAVLRRQQAQDENFRGLYVSEEEVDGLLARPIGQPRWLGDDDRWLVDVDGKLQSLAQTITRRREAGVAAGQVLALDRLRETFALSSFDIDALLVALAVEIDLRYEKLYAYLQDDVTRKRPSVELVLQLLGATTADRLGERSRFHASAPLLSNQLVHLVDDASQQHPALLSRFVKTDGRIVRWLLAGTADDGGVDERIAAFVRMDGPAEDKAALAPDKAERASRPAVWDAPLAGESGAGPVLLLRGAVGHADRVLAQARALATARGQPLLEIHAAGLVQAAEAGPVPVGLAALASLVEREARLHGGATCWHALDELVGETARSRQASLLRLVDGADAPAMVVNAAIPDATTSFPRRGCVVHAVAPPSVAQRAAAWRTALGDRLLGEDVAPAAVASRFRIALSDIPAAAAAAAHIAHQRGGAAALLAQDDLYEACRLQSGQRLGSLARKVATPHHWNDLVLPADRLRQLEELCNYVKFREQVYGNWGFGPRMSLGKGLAVLFAGSSGTGKTMAAGVVARELGYDLYKIDLSSMISKYIGETEKNLARVFDEAERTDAILFFDEADALFGKRSEVRDSHDRYANVEVGFLLQRMEEYEGVAILATNLRRNMDDAFMRRLHFTIDFPVPDEAQRLAIWQRIWPESLPRHADLDLGALARHFEVSGGLIRNAALAAAFLAASEKRAGPTDPATVRQAHVVRAIRREYQKSGMLMNESEPFPSDTSPG